MSKIAPSILSADFADLKTEINTVERAGASLIHIDVMDGHFVPNITIGPPVVESIRRITKLPLDVHLMIENPRMYVPEFIKAGADLISIHYEAERHVNRTINLIKDSGVEAGLAINPATPLTSLDEIVEELDFILLMTVNPGFGGQKFINSCYEKIRKLKRIVLDRNPSVKIEVDGGIGPDNLSKVVEAGADIIVSGSAIFGDGDSERVVQDMNRIIMELARQ